MLAAGAFCHQRLPGVAWFWAILTLLLVAFASFWGSLPADSRSRSPAAGVFSPAVRGTLALLAGCFSAGVGIARAHHFQYRVNDLSAFAGESPRFCRVRLDVPFDPVLRVLTFGQRYPTPPRQTTLARVREVLTRTGWAPASGWTLVQIQQPHPSLAAGMTIEAVGFLERPGKSMNPGQFDWQTYYRQQRILSSFNIRNAQNITLVSDPGPGWVQWWNRKTRTWLAAGFEDAPLDHALLKALVLGDYDPQLRDIRDQFQATGTSHHLAVSGMHVAVVGGFIFSLLRLANLRPRTCWWVSLAFVILYGLAVAPSPPVWRALLIFIAAALALSMQRQVRGLQLLFLVMFVLLMFNPLDLFNAGFQLSFFVVIGLIVLTPAMMQVLTPNAQIILQHEEELLEPRYRYARWIDEHGRQIVCAGLIAWLVSMPLVSWHFSRLNPWQVPASLALGPIVAVSLIAGVLKIILTAIFPSSATLLAGAAASCSGLMRKMVDALAALPASDVPMPAPPVWLVVACWLLLAASLVQWHFAGVRWAARGMLVAAFSYMIVGPYLLATSPVAGTPGGLRLTLMAVGAGQCALVEPPSGRPILLDAGSTSLSDLTFNVVAPLLRQRRITSIDSLLISHANTDHYSAAAELVEMYDIREIAVAGSFESDARAAGTGEALLHSLDSLDRPPRHVRPGDRIPLGKNSFIEVLWPDPELNVEANDRSLVFVLEHCGKRILFPGDIQTDGMEGLLSSPVDLRADVLIAPHHGSSEDVTARFVAAVSPRWILSSNDRTLTMKQRRFDQLTAGRDVRRTNDCGAITVTIDADGAIDVSDWLRR